MPERRALWPHGVQALGGVCTGRNSHTSLPRSSGAAAVLPQHLPDHWLDALLEEAELLAPEAWDPQEADRVHACCAGLLGAVLVVLMEQRGHPDQLDRSEEHTSELQ